MTIQDIIDEVIQQVGGDVDDTELSTKLLIDAKSALRRFPIFRKTGICKSIASGSLYSAASTMTKPSGVVQIIGDAWIEENGNRFEIIHEKNEANFRDIYRGSSSGRPQYFHLVANSNTIEFDRKADQAYTVYFPALISIANITAATVWSYTDEEAEILKDGIKMNYYDTEEDDTLSSKFEARFSAGLAKLEEKWMREEYPDYIEEAE